MQQNCTIQHAQQKCWITKLYYAICVIWCTISPTDRPEKRGEIFKIMSIYTIKYINIQKFMKKASADWATPPETCYNFRSPDSYQFIICTYINCKTIWANIRLHPERSGKHQKKILASIRDLKCLYAMRVYIVMIRNKRIILIYAICTQ